MKNIFSFFIDNYRFTLVLMLLLLLFGILGLSIMKREGIPPVDFATVTITTVYPGSSPEEVDEKITSKIEDEIRAVDGIEKVLSVSRSGLSVISVEIDIDRFNSDDVISDLQRAVQRVGELPEDILDDPVLQEIKSDELPVVELAITGPQDNRERDILADRLKTRVEDIRSVAAVRLDGFREREYQVLLDSDKLRRQEVGIRDVVNAVREYSQNIPAGYIKSTDRQVLVSVRSQVNRVDEIRDIIIRSNFQGYRVRVGDVARVKDGAEEEETIVCANGQPATLLTVVKKADADAIETVSLVKEKIASFKKELPEGYQVNIYNDESRRIGSRLSVVVSNAVTGFFLVIIFMLMFLPGRYGIITAISLPITVLGTLGLMAANGINFNIITMLAIVIVIGMLVDNAVVIGENYTRLKQDGENNRDAAIRSVEQFWLPITATVATTIAAFLPMLVTRGVMGQFIRYIPIVVTFALVIGLVESFFILPARLSLVKDRKNVNRFESMQLQVFNRIRSGFSRFIGFSIRHRYLVLIAITVILAGSMALSVFGNRFELFPAEAVEVYIGRYETGENDPLQYSHLIGAQLCEEIRGQLGDNVRDIIKRAGNSKMGLDDPDGKTGDNVGMVAIYIPLEKARRIKTENVLKKLRSIRIEGIERLTFDSVVNGPPVGKPLNVTLRSDSYAKLRLMADELITQIEKIDGVIDPRDDEERGKSEYLVKINHDILSRAQLTSQTVGTALRTALQGVVVSSVNRDNREFDVRVRFLDDHRSSVASLKSTEMLNRNGQLVKLSAVADIVPITGPAVRKHYDYKRSITVTSDLNPDKISDVVLNMKAKRIVSSLQEKYPMVSADFGGVDESTRESLQSLFNALVLAVITIFAILVLIFNSFARPFLILSSIPLGLVGVNWAFFLHGKPLSFLALIGIVGLAGIIVNASIVLMSHIDELYVGKTMGFHETLATASGNRLRAVLVTSLTTIGGLLPTAYGIGGYDPTLVPMTFALTWGLVTGTILTLVWIPCGLAIFNDIGKRLGRGIGDAS